MKNMKNLLSGKNKALFSQVLNAGQGVLTPSPNRTVV